MPDDVEISANRTARRRTSRSADHRSEQELLGEISAKLDKVIAVLAVQGKERDHQIEALAAAGFDSAFIGRLVGLTPGAVRTWFSRRRRTTFEVPEEIQTVVETERQGHT